MTIKEEQSSIVLNDDESDQEPKFGFNSPNLAFSDINIGQQETTNNKQNLNKKMAPQQLRRVSYDYNAARRNQLRGPSDNGLRQISKKLISDFELNF